jgi:hypothetical protein
MGLNNDWLLGETSNSGFYIRYIDSNINIFSHVSRLRESQDEFILHDFLVHAAEVFRMLGTASLGIQVTSLKQATVGLKCNDRCSSPFV